MEGVGAWKVPRFYRNGMEFPSDPYQEQRVRWAIIAIQRDLIRQAYLIYDRPLNTLGGGWGPKTDAAVRSMQKANNLVVDGVFGPKSAEVLFSDWFVWFQTINGIPDNLLLGMCRLESVLDPGAEGRTDDRDRGIAQYNRFWWPGVTDEMAFSRPDLCVALAASDLRSAYDRLGVSSWDPAIAHHNNPSKAWDWVRLGHAPDAQIRDYVAVVRKAAAR